MNRIVKKLVKIARDKEVTIIRGENDSLKALMIIGKGRKKEVTVAPKEEKVQVVKDTVNVTVNVTVNEYAVMQKSFECYIRQIYEHYNLIKKYLETHQL